MLVDNKLYKIEDKDVGEDNMFSTKVGDSIEYSVTFYNGSTCISEIVEEIIQKHFK